MSSLESLTWPISRTADAVLALARASRLPLARIDAPPPDTATDAWGTHAIGHLAGRLGLEAEAVSVVYADVDALLVGAGPALLRVDYGRLVCLVGRRGRRIEVVTPDAGVQRVEPGPLRDALCAALERDVAPQVDALLDEAGVPAGRRPRARASLLRQRLAAWRVDAGFLLRPAPGAPLRAHARWLGLGQRAALLIAASAAQYALGIFGWWLVGKGALEGRLDRGWLLAWGLVLFSQVPFRLLASWVQGSALIDAGALLKQRLMAGAVELPADAVRTQGAGQLLGRILESEAVESLALNGGGIALIAALELSIASVVLALGAGGWLHVALLVATLVASAVIGWRYHLGRSAWTRARLAMTHDLVENMVGHRTRLAQEQPERWHLGEDDALDHYLHSATRMDAHAARLLATIPRGWVVLGLLGTAPWFASASASSASLAVAVGGVLLVRRALEKLVMGVASLSGAAIGWRTAAPIFHAAARAEIPTLAVPPGASVDAAPDGRPILEASELVFRYRDRGEPVLRGCTLQLRAGERVLIEGRSGGGKSTLGAVLAGLREPESGLLLARGLDPKTLGRDGWRTRVVTAPQFHENHVFSSTFAFNLLMGRAWPPSLADLTLAEELCRELELGPLLERMPAGLSQIVGETGWQLSHGERSRLFVARALLQQAEIVVLDESFAALDPYTLQRSLACVLRRANALVVIAHP